MEYTSTEIEDVLLIKPTVYTDSRGYFFESFREKHYATEDVQCHFVQDNVSQSRKGTLRGLHYQAGDAAQDKLLMVLKGEILDVAVDLRRESPTFGKAVAKVLSEENRCQLLVPKGFAHGFLVRSPRAIVHYKCSGYYQQEAERGLMWNDPELGIDWGVADPILSEKDAQNPKLKDIPKKDLF